ncbi:hypothetical protein BDR03DRAFT_1019825 [Suillus americanus]|nr:hypothetical protein BDR03DRAFT_1019825 [Suillus americanus]
MTRMLLSAHPATSSFDPYTPSLYNDTLSLSYSLPPSSSQTGTPISSWNREVWDQQVSSPLCSSTPHFQTNHHITDSLTSNSDALEPSYIFPNSHLPQSGSEPAIHAAPMTPAAPVTPAAPTTPAASAPIDEHLDQRSSANAIGAPSMRLPAQTYAATTTISKRAAAPAVTMDEHLPSPVDAPRKTGRVRQATTRLTQANNIGDNGEAKMKRKAPIAGGSLSSSKRQKL